MGRKARVELVLDCAEPKRLATFWREALDYRDYYTDAKLAVLVPKEGIASPLLLQAYPNPKPARTACTSTLCSMTSKLRSIGYRHSALIASTKACRALGGTRWVRRSDPEQDEFCVSTGVEW
jgi:hypothetical protein